MATPTRSLEQRRAALATANRVRTARAKLKVKLKADPTLVEVIALIANPPELLASMYVVELLRACPGFGRVKIGKMIGRAQVSPSKTVGGLSDRQRVALTELLIVDANRRANITTQEATA